MTTRFLLKPKSNHGILYIVALKNQAEEKIFQMEQQSNQEVLPAAIPHSYDKDKLISFKQVNSKLPLNDIGLPSIIYRSDIIPNDIHALEPQKRAQALEAASLHISMREGFPTLPNGVAFWSQMEFEGDVAYNAFRAYLLQADEIGVRRLEVVAQDHAEFDLPSLMAMFDFYYWEYRCKAHDLFVMAADQKLRERRVMSTNNAHFLQASTIMKQLTAYFQDGSKIESMEPKDALAALDKIIKLQRVATGQSAHGLNSGEPVTQGMTVEVMMKQASKAAADPEAARNVGNKANLDMLLNNPELAGMTQALIVKIQSGGSVDD